MTARAVPLFGAEDLKRIERINAEIDRNGRAGLRNQPTSPLLDDLDADFHGEWTISFGSTRIGTIKK